MQTVERNETPVPAFVWPTVAIQLSRPGESENSLFSQIEKSCPMGRGQRCLVLAPRHDAVSTFLSELCERITRLNPEVETRLMQADKECSPADVARLVATAQRGVQDGRHSVLIVDSLNACAIIADKEDALQGCVRIFGSAQATEHGGTLTVVALAINPPTTDLDRKVLQLFQGSGNMELALRMDVAHNRLVLDGDRSGTKHAERIRSNK